MPIVLEFESKAFFKLKEKDSKKLYEIITRLKSDP